MNSLSMQKAALPVSLVVDQNNTRFVQAPDKLQAVLTPSELVIDTVSQHWTYALCCPDMVALTDRRLVICKPKLFGRMDFVDFAWREGIKVHVQAHMVTATLAITANCREVDGKCQKVTVQVEGLEKEPALRLYTKAQQMEEQWREVLRAEELKRLYAESGGAMVYANPMLPQIPAQGRLEVLKSFLDQGVIGQSEYEALKAEVISRM